MKRTSRSLDFVWQRGSPLGGCFCIPACHAATALLNNAKTRRRAHAHAGASQLKPYLSVLCILAECAAVKVCADGDGPDKSAQVGQKLTRCVFSPFQELQMPLCKPAQREATSRVEGTIVVVVWGGGGLQVAPGTHPLLHATEQVRNNSSCSPLQARGRRYELAQTRPLSTLHAKWLLPHNLLK